MRYLFFLIFLSLTANAQKLVSQDSFQVNVRPVLSAIQNDFYQMITLFEAYPPEILHLTSGIEKLNANYENLKIYCPRIIDRKCSTGLNQLRNELSLIDAKVLELLAKQKPSRSLHLDNLSGIRLMAEFQIQLSEVKGKINNLSFLIKAKIPTETKTYDLIKQMDELGTILSLAVVEYIPFPYKEDFRHFFFNFIHPIEQQIGKNKNYEFLNRNVESLNFAINLLNMNLTKRKKTPEGTAPYLSTIHNRWNSILRFYL
ncbi:MAG: hypothetical protein AB7I27_12080 [Bacteriovoracaceae bacterium]